MSDYHINIFYSESDGGYIADIPDLDSCSAFGNGPQEALAERPHGLKPPARRAGPFPLRATVLLSIKTWVSHSLERLCHCGSILTIPRNRR